MGEKLKILMIEDLPSDTEIIEQNLSKAGISFSSKRICTEKDFIRELKDFAPDIILSDYEMPEFDGISALHLAKKLASDIPFIIVTGSMNEETAVECMKQGASDYVTKEHPMRLASAIKNALKQRETTLEKKQTEETLRSSEERFRSLFNNIPIGLYRSSSDGKNLEVNSAMVNILVFPDRETLFNTNAGDAYLNKEDRLIWKKKMDREGIVHNFEVQVKRFDGKIIWIRNNARKINNADGKILYYEGSIEDITEQKQAMEKIQKMSDEWNTTFNSISDLISIQTKDFKLVRVNKAYAEAVNMKPDELAGKVCYEIVHNRKNPPPYCPHIKALSDRQTVTETFFEPLLEVHIEAAISPIFNLNNGKKEITGTVHIMKDVSERKKLEEEFRQAQKMEAIGRLSGGIAHDFNNLLVGIIGYSEIALSEIEQNNALRSHIEEIKKAGEMAASLVKQLLAFSRKQIIQSKVLDINKVILNVEDLLKRLIGENIKLQIATGKSIGMIKADPNQIEQVIINLVVNAGDAMPEGGKLTIETNNIDLDEDFVRMNSGAETGNYVMFSVADNGMGIDEKIMPNIFEPFFTTKEVGKGTGLGLSTVYGIVKQNNGYIAVDSKLGQGTTVKIYLPRIEEKIGTEQKSAGQEKPLEGSETIMIVEDEDMIRELLLSVFRDMGYKIILACNGDEAMKLIRQQQKDEIHLLLTDMIMPKMGGIELAKHIVAKFPGMKVLYMSGYADKHHLNNFKDGEAFIQKPFTPVELLNKVRKVLDG